MTFFIIGQYPARSSDEAWNELAMPRDITSAKATWDKRVNRLPIEMFFQA